MTNEKQKHLIHYGKTPIEFRLQYVQRKTLGITVEPNMQVLVKAPLDADLSEIYKKVEKKASRFTCTLSRPFLFFV